MFARRMLFTMCLAGTFVYVVPTAGQEPAASARQVEIIQAGTVHVFPSALYETLGRIDVGERYSVLARSGPEWYKIEFQGQIGYIPKELTKLLPRTAAAEQKPAPKPTGAKPPTAPATAKPAVPKSVQPAAKPARPAASRKVGAPAAEPEAIAPVDTLSAVQVSSDAVPVEVTAESGSHATMWLLLGGVGFLIIALVLVHFLRPGESAEESLHHRSS